MRLLLLPLWGAGRVIQKWGENVFIKLRSKDLDISISATGRFLSEAR